VFVGFVQFVVDCISTYRRMVNLSQFMVHMEIKLFSYDLSSHTCLLLRCNCD